MFAWICLVGDFFNGFRTHGNSNCPLTTTVWDVICCFLFGSHRVPCKILAIATIASLGVRKIIQFRAMKKNIRDTVLWVVATQIFFHVHPKNWGSDSNLTNIFSMGLKPPTSYEGIEKKNVIRIPGSLLNHQDSMEKYPEAFFCLWLKCQLVFCQLRGCGMSVLMTSLGCA